MTIKVGDKVPSATLMEKQEGGPKPVKTDDLFAGQRALTAQALSSAGAPKGKREGGIEIVKQWAEKHTDALSRTKSFLAELERTGDLSIAKLTLANSQIHELAAH